MSLRFLLLGGLLLCSCTEAADDAKKVQEERLEQFDSINRGLEAGNKEQLDAEASDGVQEARQLLDSFINNTEEGRDIKKGVQREKDSAAARQ